MYDVVIVGSGPAGLSAGIAAGRAGLSTVILEKDSIGGELVNRDSIPNYPGFPDGIGGPELRSTLVSTLEEYDPKAILTEVEGIEPGDPHTIKTADGEYEGRSVIVATGGREKELGVPGEEEYSGRGVFYCAKCDGPLYQDETIAVVGGNEHALTDTTFLAGLTDRVILVESDSELSGGAEVRGQIESESAVEVLLDTEVLELAGENGLLESIRVADTDGSNERTIDVTGLYVHVGIEPNTGFLADTIPLTEEGSVIVDANMETDIDGVYAAGDIRQGSPRMIAAGVGDGMVAVESIKQRLVD